MKRVLTGFLVFLTGLSLWLPSAGGQETTGTWAARLQALAPSRPMDYLLLAEDVAEAAASDSDRALAKHLFRLAGVLEPDELGRSACLALADLEADEEERKRLLALATLLDSNRSRLGWGRVTETSQQPTYTRSAAVALAEAFSHYRRGDGARALTALREPGAEELLRAHGYLLAGGVNRFLEDCRLYRGQLRPSLTDEDLARMYRLEIALLAGENRPWSTEVLLSGGKPLIEVDPENIEITLGVDVDRPYFRNGQWVADAAPERSRPGR